MRRLFRGATWGSDRGAAAVEFALVFPVLILVLIGIIEYGSVFNTQLMLTSAAREGARTMAVTGDAAQARTAVINAAVGLSPALTAANIVVTPSSCSSTTNVSVTIDYAKPYLTGLFGATVALEGKSTRKCFG
jgi:Flp pilus assembly protein TadG